MSYAAKPEAFTNTRYPGPGVSAGAVKTPSLFEVMVRIKPRLALEISTLAFGTTEPLASRTVPEIPARPAADCPNAAPASNTNIA